MKLTEQNIKDILLDRYDTRFVIDFDFNYAGFGFHYGYEKEYNFKNEIGIHFLFWKLYIHW